MKQQKNKIQKVSTIQPDNKRHSFHIGFTKNDDDEMRTKTKTIESRIFPFFDQNDKHFEKVRGKETILQSYMTIIVFILDNFLVIQKKTNNNDNKH
ncbi:hypothetical protein DERP_010182 [Dermatophagoides pteronyssinus]|uniref:Uncharacterized protein n=1 Tax=Dermatophagoides pteronyssinus TaxID=6956 RepID=A0ABQ8J7I0_DERPT|nr:hypothetical protein DERP_010182 [Dermatophagoides pteronyssinus]